MTRLRPVVVPVAALALATVTPSATAQPRKPVSDRADPPTAQALAAQLADLPPRAAIVQTAISLPLAVPTPPGAAALEGGRSALAQPPASVLAPGRPSPYDARGPP